jgi:hypothetical protein
MINVDFVTMLAAILSQVDPLTGVTPDGVPTWAWVILVAFATWFARDLWPWLKLRAETAEKHALSSDLSQDERYLRAFEQASAAQASTASALDKVAQSLDLFARNSVAMTFELAELRREVRGRRSGDVPHGEELPHA